MASGKERKEQRLNSQLGKLPPQATDLEEAVLGAVMLEKSAYGLVADVLKPDSFYKDAHKEIWQAITDLNHANEPVDILLVTKQLRKNGTLEVTGGAYYITQLTNRVSSAANIEFHARVIAEQAIKRNLIKIAGEIQQNAYEDTQDVFELMDSLEGQLSDIQRGSTNKEPRVSKDVLSELFEDIHRRQQLTGEITGIPSGIQAVDNETSGWQNSDLIIVAARPGMGKTSFVLTALRNASIDHQVPTAIFSLEMNAMQLIGRLVGSETHINNQRVLKGKLYEREFADLVHGTAKLAKAPLWIDDTPGIGILELRAKARRLKQKHNIQLVVVDYLQLMSGDRVNKYGSQNREQEISTISRALKNLAKELNVPVIALSQLSRAVETRGGDKRPHLSDLRESGSIEQDADMVAFLYRPEYYGITEDEEGMPTNGYAEFIIEKHRNGSLERVPMKFIPHYTKFLDLEDMATGSSQFPTDSKF